MPSESVLDVEVLLAPISDQEPAGEPVSFGVREQLEEARKEINPEDFDADDPTRPTEAKLADWGGIERLTKQTLRESSKDLLVAARLTESLLKRHGFVGLADGFVLLRRMLEDCWDRMFPSIEDGDLEVRAGPFNWISEESRGARFPPSIRSTPMLRAPEGSVSWYTWKQAQGGDAALKERLEKAVAATTREEAQTLTEDLDRCYAELVNLDRTLGEKLGREAPGLTDLKSAVGDCRSLAQQVLQRKGPAASAEATEEGEAQQEEDSDSAGGSGRGGAERAMRSRADVYAQLARAADLLEQLEPHSPIPYLIRKAVELGAMPFPQLMRALIRDDSVLSGMQRELGFKDPSE